jgi:uroporphyrinogen-III synthase
MERPLQGKGIVVTRPAHQAQRLVRLIEEAGGRALRFPAIEIRDIEDPRPLEALLARLDEFDIVIFVSPNAARKGLERIGAHRTLPAGAVVAAIGSGSRRELARHGVKQVIVPERGFDSEALLEQPALREVAGKRIVIFRGVGGRELLGERLAARGARVEYAECYRRARPELDCAPLLAAWARGEVHAVTASSSEGLRNFHEMIGAAGRERLRATPLFVPHPRIAEAARALGLERVQVTDPGDEGVVAALADYFAQRAC